MDQWSLKFILDQRLMTIPHTLVTKLFGYDISMEYRPSKVNIVADALSRHDEETLGVRAISGAVFDLYEAIRAELLHDAQAKELCAQLAAGTVPED